MELWNIVLISCTVFLAFVGAVTITVNLLPLFIDAYYEHKKTKAIRDRMPDWADVKDWEDTKLRRYE